MSYLKQEPGRTRRVLLAGAWAELGALRRTLVKQRSLTPKAECRYGFNVAIAQVDRRMLKLKKQLRGS